MGRRRDRLERQNTRSSSVKVESWISQINIIKEIRIFRCLRKVDDLYVVRQEVHFFSDASQLAYGCCAYLRTIYASGSPSMHLIQAIGHLVPRNNTKTIQRLELEACFLILKLRSNFQFSIFPHLSEIMHYITKLN